MKPRFKKTAKPPSIPNTYWIEPGRLLAGGHPASRSFEETMERIQALVAAGVTAFVDLTEPDEHIPYQSLLPAHAGPGQKEVVYIRKPLRDHEVPESAEVMLDIVHCLKRALDDGHLVYLHCRAGIGRTGTVLGCYFIQCGQTPEQALAHLQQLWERGGRTAVWPHTPETTEQINFIRNWGRPPTFRWPSWKRILKPTS